MPKKALRCLVEIDIHAITSPGTWLPKRDDLYITVNLFGQVRRTRYVTSIFPLIFHDKFKFDKVFYSTYEPSQVADCLDDLSIRINLIQLSELFEDGRVLAWYEASARDFLYPYPSYSSSYGTHDREVLLERSLSFPGICPRLEFSTKTTIQETMTPLLEPWDLDEEVATYTSGTGGRLSRSRTRSASRTRSPSLSRRGGYERPTMSSVTRSRSVSPALRSQLRDLKLEDDEPLDTTSDRPPFVVKKVEPTLIGRNPGTRQSRGRSPNRQRRKSTSGLYTENNGNSYDYCTKHRKDYFYSGYNDKSYTTDSDSDVLARIDSKYYRPRSVSPTRYRASLLDRYYDRALSPTRAQLLRERIELALERNRSLERLEHLASYRSYTPSLYDSLAELELDLELARRRRYLL